MLSVVLRSGKAGNNYQPPVRVLFKKPSETKQTTRSLFSRFCIIKAPYVIEFRWTEWLVLWYKRKEIISTSQLSAGHRRWRDRRRIDNANEFFFWVREQFRLSSSSMLLRVGNIIVRERKLSQLSIVESADSTCSIMPKKTLSIHHIWWSLLLLMLFVESLSWV